MKDENGDDILRQSVQEDECREDETARVRLILKSLTAVL